MFSLGSHDASRIRTLQQAGAKTVLLSYKFLRGRKENLYGPPAVIREFPQVFIDSGAFSSGNSNKRLSLGAYTRFLQQHIDGHPNVEGYFNLDDMADPDETARNQVTLETSGLNPVPVYHVGEPDDILRRYVESGKYPLIGIGGIAVGRLSTKRLREEWDRIASSYPRQDFHLLGTSQLAAFNNHQPYSFDTTSWLTDKTKRMFVIGTNGIPTTRPLESDEEGLTTDFLRKCNIGTLIELAEMKWVGGG